MPDEILTLREVAEYLKIGERTAYRLVQDGKLPAFKVGGAWRLRRGALDTWMAQQTAANTEPKSSNTKDDA